MFEELILVNQTKISCLEAITINFSPQIKIYIFLNYWACFQTTEEGGNSSNVL
jgi:hypothetical protein